MYANSNTSSSNDNSSSIPEWKKKLILKKRAGNLDERHPAMLSESNCDNNDNFSSKFCVSEIDFQEVSPLKTVTIGNLNVELRSIKSALETPTDSEKFDNFESENEDCQDLQYGPGIVDRLCERFLNMGAKKQHKPVRRFSSLENLPCTFVRPFIKFNTHSIRQNGFKVSSGNYYSSGNVKKAQSMETLIYNTQEQPIFSASRRSNAFSVKAQILAKNLNPIMHTCEIGEPSKKSPTSPGVKSVRRWDFNRSPSAPSINEDELPKPDTVKHVKKIFEASLGTCLHQTLTSIFVNSDMKQNENVSDDPPLAKLCIKEMSLTKRELLSLHPEAIDNTGKNSLEKSSHPQTDHEVSQHSNDVSEGMLRLQETTSIVFDFRGKDIKPNISLSPTPFGCRPARVPPKKRSGSPPCTEAPCISDHSEEDWDEMDVGADLPAFSGIIFTGENVKVGRGSILQIRNKKLTIQFDEQATSTFEYPSENASPCENTDSLFNSLLNLANSRYVPEFGSRNESLDEDPLLPTLVPTKPEDASGWSSSNTTDILF